MDAKTYLYGTSGIVGAISIFYIWSSWSRKRTIDRTTALNDLPNVGRPRTRKRIEGTAVICGGSVTGLWAARLCADHFEDVVVVEPETWLSSEEARTAPFNEMGEKKFDSKRSRIRIMHYTSAHGFQPFYLQVLQHLCPEAENEMKKGGIIFRDGMFNQHVDGKLVDAVPYFDYPNGDAPKVFFSTRDTFERILRRLLYKPGGRIRFVHGTVTGFQKSDSKNENRIESVIVRMSEGNEEKMVPASLVVDCTGATQAGLKLVKRLSPNDTSKFDDKTDSYDPKLHYLTLRVSIPAELRLNSPIPEHLNDAGGFLYTFVPLREKDRRILVVNKVEGNQLQFCLGAWGEIEMPRTFDETIDYIRTLRTTVPVPDWVTKLLAELRDLDAEADFNIIRCPPCAWVHYEQVDFLPQNFVSMGDAVMYLNPLYGQGCTKGMIGAMTLNKILWSIPESNKPVLPMNLSRLFFQLQAERTQPLWDGQKASDYGYETTVPQKGESLKEGAFARKYLDLVIELIARGDKTAISVWWHVRNFLVPFSDVVGNPILVAKVAFLALRQSLGLV